MLAPLLRKEGPGGFFSPPYEGGAGGRSPSPLLTKAKPYPQVAEG